MIPNQIGLERADYSAIAEYDSVHPSYGTLDDFREVLESAHRMADASL
jgi:glycosidase